MQLVDAAVSAAANGEEADDASSDKDFRAKADRASRIKEARLRLRVLRRTGFVGAELDPLIEESDALRRIVSSIIRKNASKSVTEA